MTYPEQSNVSDLVGVTEAIKPCPFCGATPEVHPSNPVRHGNAWGAVQCENTECPTYDDALGHGVKVEDGETVADDRGSDRYKAAAIARWNRRP